MAPTAENTLTFIFTILGATYLLSQALKLCSFIQLHFLHKSKLDRYKIGDSTWALVTGATDGIGRALAEELCAQGFNIIIHGRNPQKLQTIQQDLSSRWPKREIRTLQLDAAKDASNVNLLIGVAEELSKVNLRVLINNVGGSGGEASFVALEDRTSEQVGTFFDVNARFPTEITRVLLPQLRNNAASLIINIGSISSEFGLPYLGVYAGCKAYNKSWSRSLTAEMRAENTGVEIFCLLVSAVATDAFPRDLSLFVPSAKQIARHILGKVGCGRSLAFAYWAHEVQAGTFWALPGWVADKAVIDIAKREKAEEEVRLKKT